MNIAFGQDKTKYRGQRLKVATITMNGRNIVLGLGDTSRCASSKEAAERTLKNLAEAAGNTDWSPGAESEQLRAHCRELLGLHPA